MKCESGKCTQKATLFYVPVKTYDKNNNFAICKQCFGKANADFFTTNFILVSESEFLVIRVIVS